eukprot:c7370_g1_i1.p1 GENE.c7370_g1_i1~~c7370_g1_i1.p1  ORF type:complete len:437 (-),score=102.47 c7370_g1_i1:289-1599(-)
MHRSSSSIFTLIFLASLKCLIVKAVVPLIIDTDPTVTSWRSFEIDDVLAVLMAFAHHQSPDALFDIKAIVSTFGNADSKETFQALLEIAEHEGIIEQGVKLSRGNGKGAPLTQASDAVEVIREVVVNNPPASVVVVCLGSLHNVAAFSVQYPEIARRLGHIVILGGSNGEGWRPVIDKTNLNFVVDPAAVNVVMSLAVPKTLIPIEACLQVPLSPTHVNDLLGPMCPHSSLSRYSSRLRRWVYMLGAFGYAMFSRFDTFVEFGAIPWDAIVIAGLITPDFFSSVQCFHMKMESTKLSLSDCTVEPRYSHPLSAATHNHDHNRNHTNNTDTNTELWTGRVMVVRRITQPEQLTSQLLEMLCNSLTQPGPAPPTTPLQMSPPLHQLEQPAIEDDDHHICCGDAVEAVACASLEHECSHLNRCCAVEETALSSSLTAKI